MWKDQGSTEVIPPNPAEEKTPFEPANSCRGQALIVSADRVQRFHIVARGLVREIIVPLMEKFRSLFSHAEPLQCGEDHTCSCLLPPTANWRTPALLRFRVRCDRSVRTISIDTVLFNPQTLSAIERCPAIEQPLDTLVISSLQTRVKVALIEYVVAYHCHEAERD